MDGRRNKLSNWEVEQEEEAMMNEGKVTAQGGEGDFEKMSLLPHIPLNKQLCFLNNISSFKVCSLRKWALLMKTNNNISIFN